MPRRHKKTASQQQSKNKRCYTQKKHSQPNNKQKPSVATTPPISNSLSYELTHSKAPIIERDMNSNITHSISYISDERFEYWVEYDGVNPIKYVDSRGRSWGAKYNSLGNISHYWDYTGYYEEYRYYANELVICTTSTGLKLKKRVKRIDGKYINRDIFSKSQDVCI